jgi:hypothetical protein
MSQVPWLPPSSVRYLKHLPVKDPRKSWREIVLETTHGPAKYGPDGVITEQMIHQLEGDTVNAGLADPRFELPQQKENVRSFWAEFEHVIGASCGETTKFHYVEYRPDGIVHGRPMTERQLIEKGMVR